MSTATTEEAARTAPPVKTNHIGASSDEYKGQKSTLCKGCGHTKRLSFISAGPCGGVGKQSPPAAPKPWPD